MSFKKEHDKAERDWIKYLRTLETKDLAKELYKKHKRTVDEVCEYLRHRRQHLYRFLCCLCQQAQRLLAI
jgi:hypothetical protein